MWVNGWFPLGSGNNSSPIPVPAWNPPSLSKPTLGLGGHDPFSIAWERKLFLHMKHPLRKDGKLSLPIREAVLSRGQKDTFLVACGFSLYFLQVSWVWRREEGRSVESWDLPSLHRGASWPLSMIFCLLRCALAQITTYFAQLVLMLLV